MFILSEHEFTQGASPARTEARQQAALEQFLASVERRAFVMARKATGGRDEALDLVQDAMVQLARRYAARPEAEWGALFYTILQSRIRDWARRRKVRRRLFGWLDRRDPRAPDPLAEVADPRARDAGEMLGERRAQGALAEAIARLPLRQQQAFLLRAWEGLDVADTARVMQCSAGSVKTHYSRAVHALRQALEEHEP